ncbi:MAG: hypothetical protein II135_05435 [Clostridia bacterium]|nr:hypothetical protein [Clostridia bacterium]MBQ3869458.1 hypothetical protein [Clostridia bacterium]
MNDIGSKIKITASILFVLEIIGSIIAAIVCFSDSLAGIGCALLFGGPLAAWLIFIMVYGFGQLVENSDQLVENSYEMKRKLSAENSEPNESEENDTSQNGKYPTVKHKEDGIIRSVEDEVVYTEFECPKCKTKMTFPLDYIKQDPAVICPECNYGFNVFDYYEL